MPEPILSAYTQFGAVPLLGLPISAAMETDCEGTPCTVQWFERSRVEVLITGERYRGRIGADYLSGRGRRGSLGMALPPTGVSSCRRRGTPSVSHS
ncbi:MAG: hypothetical protein AAGF95_11520 [Chloroflexota bacterium]